jgi:hypothetical protein
MFYDTRGRCEINEIRQHVDTLFHPVTISHHGKEREIERERGGEGRAFRESLVEHDATRVSV